MALSQSALSALLDAIRAGGSEDVLREAMSLARACPGTPGEQRGPRSTPTCPARRLWRSHPPRPSSPGSPGSMMTAAMGVYVVYEVGSETYVRRSRAWVKADAVQVRRSGAWSDAGPDVYVRRGGVWVKA